MEDEAPLAWLQRHGTARGELVALAVGPDGLGLARAGAARSWSADAATVATLISAVDVALEPRWVGWTPAEARALVPHGVRLRRAWDLSTVHRLLAGGWAAPPARVWAHVHGLDPETAPTDRPRDLFDTIDDADSGTADAVRADGHLDPRWLQADASGHVAAPRLARWAELALSVATTQADAIAALRDHPRALLVARSESTTELLCAELAHDGLPIDRAAAEQIIGELAGARPANERAWLAQRAERDAAVLVHLPAGPPADLRNPVQVRAALRRVGVEVPDTRAWRLEALAGTHPFVDALLQWRKAERIATTYGYQWLDEHVGTDGRLRGDWTSCDGAAGRMTASAGLHNLPAMMRPAVVADPGHVFVRADLGQIEPRVLAAVAGDAALSRATTDDDLYLPVAAQLGVDRPTAKVAVLGAMYGQTTGHGAHALQRLHRAYPVAMAYLDEADRRARAGHDLRTYGGRALRMDAVNDPDEPSEVTRRRDAARGRYGRNAVIQGAAAELFKLWAVTVRTRLEPVGGRIVLCLHDELLVHVPTAAADEAVTVVRRGLDEAVARWAPNDATRFIAEVSIITRWSDAK